MGPYSCGAKLGRVLLAEQDIAVKKRHNTFLEKAISFVEDWNRVHRRGESLGEARNEA